MQAFPVRVSQASSSPAPGIFRSASTRITGFLLLFAGAGFLLRAPASRSHALAQRGRKALIRVSGKVAFVSCLDVCVCVHLIRRGTFSGVRAAFFTCFVVFGGNFSFYGWRGAKIGNRPTQSRSESDGICASVSV